jgi:prepilin peptidase CpaA
MATLLLLVIAATLIVAAYSDIAVRRIPNAAPAVVALAGLALRVMEGLGPLAATLAASGLLFVLLFVLFARGWLGGGDVKLATALALGLPPQGIWTLVVATALAGGVLAAGYLLMHRLAAGPVAPAGRQAAILARVAAAEAWRIRRRGPLPYGIAIAVGALTAFGNQFVVQ